MPELHDRLAQQLFQAHERLDRFQPVLRDGKPLTPEQAYQVQDAFVALLSGSRNAAIAGYKIGVTSAAMQASVGLTSPVCGVLFADQLRATGAGMSAASYGRLGLEFEIAVRLSKDVPARPGVFPTIAEIAECVDAVCPAIELVDDRGADYAALDGGSLLADNAWNAGVVLGPWHPAPAGLAQCKGRVLCNGSQAGSGLVGDASGHPFQSVAWIAEDLSHRGKVLRAGMIVMTGSITRTLFPAGDEQWSYSVEGLGAVEAHVEP
ncbi:fumarylacetoacetate hydrolase family protein [soil metagenome]